MEPKELECIALERGYPRTPEGERLVNEDEVFTLASHLEFSPRWMKTKSNSAAAKKLVAEAEEHQSRTKGDAKDAEIRRLKAELAQAEAKQE